MQNKKYMILCIKGFGDAILSCNFANRINVNEYIVITSKKNEILVKSMLPHNSVIYTINWLHNTFELFSLSKVRIYSLFRWIKIRRLLSSFSDLGFSPLIDVNNFRNKLLYFGLSGEYPKINNVYQHYSDILGQDFYKPIKSLGSILIFPFGSEANRCMPKELILSLCKQLILSNKIYKVVIHASEIKKVDELNDQYIFYQSPKELSNLICDASIIISVDSFPLHMAIFKNKEILVATNSYNLFIHPILIDSNCVFKFDKIVEALKVRINK